VVVCHCNSQVLANEQTERNADSNFEVGLANRPLNRYDDILPYDEHRVVLRNCDSGHDYINASYIKNVLPGTPPMIASQGPIKATVRDFWHMILQENVRIVAMVSPRAFVLFLSFHLLLLLV
jgi:protein tyrosine phosphatase